jgi:hypothetical protein
VQEEKYMKAKMAELKEKKEKQKARLHALRFDIV